jgi:ABC-2 type transport system ATP-binding protein
MADPRLELIDLTKRYGDTVALDGLSFEVGAGQMFGFVGPNGAGKTKLSAALRLARR